MLSRQSTRRAQPYRKGSSLRRPGGALAAMLAGKPANQAHPMQANRALAKQSSQRRRRRRPLRKRDPFLKKPFFTTPSSHRKTLV